ncbi:hypothetical protein RV11_GL002659 [Enterococcus phoeniculicola]|nr:hypothetical protein RV11_GL002659 [Enterococcus phoeniculicola]
MFSFSSIEIKELLLRDFSNFIPAHQYLFFLQKNMERINV